MVILFYTKEQIADFQKQIFITLLLGNYYLQSLEYETEKKSIVWGHFMIHNFLHELCNQLSFRMCSRAT